MSNCGCYGHYGRDCWSDRSSNNAVTTSQDRSYMAAEETNPREEVANVTNPTRRVAGVNPVIGGGMS